MSTNLILLALLGKQRPLTLVGFSLLALISSGCTYSSNQSHLTELPLELPQAFSQSGQAALDQHWWLAFHDPDLNALIEQALAHNFSLKSTWERLQQARATYKKRTASFIPSLEGEASASHSIAEINGKSTSTDSLFLGLSASYEVDLWGGIQSAADAAKLDIQASKADLEAAAMTLSGEVASAWYTLVAQDSTLRLLEQQIATNTQVLDLISAQFRTGQVPIADVLQQRQVIEAKKGDQIQLLAQREQTANQIHVLLGRSPGMEKITVAHSLVSLPPLPLTGIPAERILARPDIRRARYVIEAADKEIAVAVADRFPALRLTASLNTSGSAASDLFNNYLASLAASLLGPIIDGGQRKAEVERTQAVAMEAVHDYGQSVLTAIGEVENALIEEQQQVLYLKSLQKQLDLASQTMDQVKERYLKGVENYQRVLTAMTSLQDLQKSQVSGQVDLLQARIQLCRAMGQGWGYNESITDNTL